MTTKTNTNDKRHCQHGYCKRCASRIIKHALSSINQIPKCWNPSPTCGDGGLFATCFKPLSVVTYKRSLPERYQIKQENAGKYVKQNFLVNGFIRYYNKCYKLNIPIVINSIISNYYALVCYNLIPCQNCKISGYIEKKCTNCCGKGTCIAYNHCETCNNTEKVLKHSRCRVCKGNGNDKLTKMDETCRLCANKNKYKGKIVAYISRKSSSNIDADFSNCNWVTQHECKKCGGTGIDNENKCECSECNGSGVLNKYCKKCSIDKTSACQACNGCGMEYPETVDCQCAAMKSRYYHRKCSTCDNKGYTKKTKCNKCLSHKYIALLDFNKVKNNQKQCQSCSQYFTKNCIINWSRECYHQYCVKCTIEYIRDQLNGANQIPKCINRKHGCNVELTMSKMQFIAKLVTFDDIRRWYCTNYKNDLMGKLQDKLSRIITDQTVAVIVKNEKKKNKIIKKAKKNGFIGSDNTSMETYKLFASNAIKTAFLKLKTKQLFAFLKNIDHSQMVKLMEKLDAPSNIMRKKKHYKKQKLIQFHQSNGVW